MGIFWATARRRITDSSMAVGLLGGLQTVLPGPLGARLPVFTATRVAMMLFFKDTEGLRERDTGLGQLKLPIACCSYQARFSCFTISVFEQTSFTWFLVFD